MRPFFSIIVVCLNPGEKLRATLESIEKQSFLDYEVIIKDGFSADGSLPLLWSAVHCGTILPLENDPEISG